MPKRHFKLALLLGAAGGIAAALVFPYLLALLPKIAAEAAHKGIPLPLMAAAQSAQAFVIFTLAAWIGLKVGQPMGLDAPVLRAWAYREPPVPFDQCALTLACAIGLVTGMAIIFIDHGMQPWMPKPTSGLPVAIERWRGFLASFYGGIGEEIQLRLFVMTPAMWLAWKLFARHRATPPPLAAWVAIVLAALLFAAGHLPAAAQVWPLDAVVVLRTMVLNVIVGIPCGWLFWRHGLEYAIAAHFSADIVLHVAAA